MQAVTVNVAFRGGGQPRNIIALAFVAYDGRTTRVAHGLQQEVINVPRELAGRFEAEFQSIDVDNSENTLPCGLRLDCGGESFEVLFTLMGGGQTWEYSQPPFSGPLFSASLHPAGVQRLYHWILNR